MNAVIDTPRSLADTGPNDSEKKMLVMKIMAIPARCALRCVFGTPFTSGGNDATMAVRIEYVTTKLPAPNMSGRFRPTVSSTSVMKLQVTRERSTLHTRLERAYKMFAMGPTAP